MLDEIDVSLDNGDASPSEPEVEEVVYETTFDESFLNHVPEEHRPIVGKYVKDIDGKITKKFQEIHNQYKPYKELGEVEQLQRALHFTEHFQQNGEQVFAKMLKGFINHYGPENAYKELNRVLGLEVPEVSDNYIPEGGWEQEEPDPKDVQLQNVMSELEQLKAWRAEQQEQSEMAEAATQLDALIGQMHNARPDIPEEFMINGFAAGQNPQQILESWDSWFGGKANGQQPQQNSRPTPPIVGGQGGVPSSGQVDASKLDKQGRMNLAEQWLAAAQNQ